MKSFLLIIAGTLTCLAPNTAWANHQLSQEKRALREQVLASLKSRVTTKRLANGMLAVHCSAPNTNKVTVAAKVKVGSRQEKVDEWGIAHILEHMFYKGTTTRPEGYLEKLHNAYGMQLGRDANAHTWYDHTYYYFISDTQNWRVFGEVLADFFMNMTIDPATLTSELGAVSQEIKVGRRDQPTLDFADMLPMNHPYSHDVIGYKEEVFSYTPEQVMAFFKKHYTPHNTTVIVCGNFAPDQAFAYLEQAFAGFQAPTHAHQQQDHQRLPFYAGFSSTTKTVYHEHPYHIHSFDWLGAPAGTSDEAALRYTVYALQKRLTHKWIDEAGWCTAVGVNYCAFDGVGEFHVRVQPREEFNDIPFKDLLMAEITSIIHEGLTPTEYEAKFYEDTLGLVSCSEDANLLAFNFAITSGTRENVVEQFFGAEELLINVRRDDIQQATHAYLRPFLMHHTLTMPLPAAEKQAWDNLQTEVSAYDAALLAARTRSEPMPANEKAIPESALLAAPPAPSFDSFTLSNGLTVYWRSEALSKNCTFSLVVRDYEALERAARAAHKGFAYGVASTLLLHGSGAYSKKEFDDLCALDGISLQSWCGRITASALDVSFEKAMERMRYALDNPHIPHDIFERKKAEAIELMAKSQKNLGYQFREWLVRRFFPGRPGEFDEATRIADIQNTTIEDVREYLALLRDPLHVAAVMVGDFDRMQAYELAERYFGSLQGLSRTHTKTPKVSCDYAVIEDQVTVDTSEVWVTGLRSTCYLNDADAPALALLNDHLGHLLFQIRERTGLFYSGGGWVRNGTKEVPGMTQLLVLCVPHTMQQIMLELKTLLNELWTTPLTNEVVATLKRGYMQKAGKYLHTPATLAEDGLSALQADEHFDYQTVFDERVKQVTAEQVNAVIKKYYDPSTWAFVSLGKGLPEN